MAFTHTARRARQAHQQAGRKPIAAVTQLHRRPRRLEDLAQDGAPAERRCNASTGSP
jgi:hypothetical protein